MLFVTQQVHSQEDDIMKKCACCFMVMSFVLLCSCRSARSTADIPAVGNFDGERYMGTWYEIARLPTWFERDLDGVTAEYSLRKDGKITVLNSGVRNGKATYAEGIARFKEDAGKGELEVSFQRPFYGAYRIIYLPADYSVALVTGADRSYLWILARKAVLPEQQLQQLLDMAAKWDFDTSALIFPKPATAAK